MANSQSVKAVAKYIRMSPHKIRRVIDQIRGRSYQEALMILSRSFNDFRIFTL